MKLPMRTNRRTATLRWILAFASGFAIFVVLCCFSDTPRYEKTISIMMWPGGLLAQTFGQGRDDLWGFLLYLGGNFLFL
jgi:hypothetical protein